ncbi:ABC transporter ATP-binding protein [Pseudooceanicola sp. MF1-13]|uniref:ABC transporter ATP-binding protein n=1 Tax=Pseudooceanicola sp. MF1-13 TaxID=3379095 RepID=UPI00389133E6
MSIAHLLEDFGSAVASASPGLSEEEVESVRLEGFEAGYKAGWEDALRSQSEEHARISEEFARNLSDLSFTYHEAHSHVMQSMAPLLQDLVDTILPEVVRETIGFRVVEQLNDMAKEAGAQTIELAASEGDLPVIQALLDRDFGFPISARADASLAEGQVILRMTGDERQIDMSAVMTGIKDAVAGILDDTERTLKHG